MFDGNKIKAEEALRVTLGSFQKPDSDAPTLRRYDVTTLPPEVFGNSIIGELAKDCNRVYGVPEPLAAMTALGVLSVACGRQYKVTGAASGYSSYANLYIMVVAESGTGKSSVFKELAKPVIEASAALSKEAAMDCMEREVNADILKNEHKTLQREVSKDLNVTLYKDTPEYGEKVHALAQVKAEMADLDGFEAPCLYVQNTTPEALAKTLQSNGGTTGILSDEAAEVIKVAMGKYSNGSGDISLLTNAWSSGPLDYKRIGRAGVSLPSATLSMMLMVQPDVLDEFLAHRETLQQGLLARFLLINVPAKRRDRGGELLELEPGLMSRWNGLINAVLDRRNQEGETIIEATPEARDAFDEFYNKTNRLIENECSIVRPLYARWSENAIRVSVLLAIADGHCSVVDVETARRAISLVEWCGGQVDGLLDYSKSMIRDDRIRKLAKIVTSKRKMPKRDLMRNHGCNSEDVERLLEESGGDIVDWKEAGESGREVTMIGLKDFQ